MYSALPCNGKVIRGAPVQKQLVFPGLLLSGSLTGVHFLFEPVRRIVLGEFQPE